MSDEFPGEQPPSDQPPRNRPPSAYSLGVQRPNDRPPDEPPPSAPPCDALRASVCRQTSASRPVGAVNTWRPCSASCSRRSWLRSSYLYVNPAANPVVAKDFAREQTRIAALTMQVQALSSRVEQVASRPTPAPPPPVDLKPLEDRIAALEAAPRPNAYASRGPEATGGQDRRARSASHPATSYHRWT